MSTLQLQYLLSLAARNNAASVPAVCILGIADMPLGKRTGLSAGLRPGVASSEGAATSTSAS